MNIRQIALLCGVSTATVSRVINNSPSVSAVTREKVLGVMEREGYVPNAFAGGFGRNALKIVGILCADIANLYYAGAVSLLERELRARGIDTLLCCTGYGQEDKKEALTALVRKRVDAVILVGSAYREERDNTHIREAARQIPVFMLNAHVQIPNVFCILCDEREAISATVRRLAAAGRRAILYIHDMDKWAWAGTQKLAGYRDGLEECGLEEDSRLIRFVNSAGNDMQAAQKLVEELLRSGLEFDSILASEDVLAIGAQKAMFSKRRSVPIIGFNNSQLALCCTPSLTSIDNMLSVICPMAVEMLEKLLGGDGIPSKVVVSGALVERETFRACAEPGEG
ncbi:MAG: LacI family transcriptional regulator [Oscillospiraceae bacterium]|nr:LacI family transcriptional regulator [Oscillospiraceae bacterium]